MVAPRVATQGCKVIAVLTSSRTSELRASFMTEGNTVARENELL